MNKRIILASNSPRRHELLKMIGLKFDIIADNTPEPINKNMTPDAVVCELAEFKGRNVSKKLDNKDGAVIIAADTVVAVDNEILGKPKDEQDAQNMLLRLSGKTHCVYTGVYVLDTDTGISNSFYEKTEVFFKKLDIDEIKDYIITGEPMDKAGAYGIQNLGSLFVERINGDYFNVVGLPLSRLGKVLKDDFGIKII